VKADYSVVLRVRGESLEPLSVSDHLGLEPHSSASRNDPLQLSGDRSQHRSAALATGSGESIQLNLLRPMGSWQRFPPPELARSGLERQLEYWVELLKARRVAVKTLTNEGLEVVLSCVVQVDGAAAFRLPPPLQRRIARLGVGLDFSILNPEQDVFVPTASPLDRDEKVHV
jgi:hypothetical protein